jgi:hypothetical protein
MALIEKSIVDKIEVLEINSIQVRTANIIEKDGVEIARNLHRHVLNPGDDVSGEDPKVQAIALAVWTEEIIEQYLQSQNQNQIQDESNA